MKIGADAVGADRIDGVLFRILVVAVAADHIDVELRNDAFDRNRGMIGQILGAPQPALLSCMPREHQGTTRTRSCHKSVRHTDERC